MSQHVSREVSDHIEWFMTRRASDFASMATGDLDPVLRQELDEFTELYADDLAELARIEREEGEQ